MLRIGPIIKDLTLNLFEDRPCFQDEDGNSKLSLSLLRSILCNLEDLHRGLPFLEFSYEGNATNVCKASVFTTN